MVASAGGASGRAPETFTANDVRLARRTAALLRLDAAAGRALAGFAAAAAGVAGAPRTALVEDPGDPLGLAFDLRETRAVPRELGRFDGPGALVGEVVGRAVDARRAATPAEEAEHWREVVRLALLGEARATAAATSTMPASPAAARAAVTNEIRTAGAAP